MKMSKVDRARKVAKVVVAAVMLAAVVAAFWGVRECAFVSKLQFTPAMLMIDSVAAFAAVVVLLAVLWGRLYCEIVCPLGIVQDIVRWIARKKVRRVCSRLPETKRQMIVKWTLFGIWFVVGVAGFSFAWLDPYAIFGRGVTLTGGLFFIVLVLAFVGKGRIWCNWICPVGTLLQLISRISIFKDKVAKCDHCEECRKCFSK